MMKRITLSIQTIGTQRFWFGTISGLTSLVALHLLLTYFRFGLLMLNLESAVEYNVAGHWGPRLIIIALASVFGTTTAQSVWFSKPRFLSAPFQRSMRASYTYAKLFQWLSLLTATRLAYVWYITGPANIDTLLFDDVRLALPILLFLFGILISWQPLLKKLKVRRWIIGVLAINVAIGASLLSFYRPIDLAPLYAHRYEKDIAFVNYTVERAKSTYSIEFSEKELTILHSKISEDKFQLESELYHRLVENEPLTLKEIIKVECIVLSGFSRSAFSGDIYNLHRRDIIQQLLINQYLLYPEDSAESKEIAYMVLETFHMRVGTWQRSIPPPPLTLYMDDEIERMIHQVDSLDIQLASPLTFLDW